MSNDADMVVPMIPTSHECGKTEMDTRGSPTKDSSSRTEKEPVSVVVYQVHDVEVKSGEKSATASTQHHAAILLYDEEWSFRFTENGSGVFSTLPKSHPDFKFLTQIDLGETPRSKTEIFILLRRLIEKYQGNTFDAKTNNACSFSNEFAQALGVGKIPRWIGSRKDTGSSMPSLIDSDDISVLRQPLGHIKQILRKSCLKETKKSVTKSVDSPLLKAMKVMERPNYLRLSSPPRRGLAGLPFRPFTTMGAIRYNSPLNRN